MKRDEANLDVPAAPGAAAGTVRRTPAYLGSGGSALFAWYHEAEGAPPGDLVAVICPPVGSEYTRSHRS